MSAVRGKNKSQQITPSHHKLSSDKNDDGIVLSIPVNITSLQYTKHPRWQLFSPMNKGSTTCDNMMRKMIALGYIPTTTRSLQNLMTRNDTCETIADDAWPMISYEGDTYKDIQSSILEKHALGKPQYIDSNMEWYAQ